MQIPLESDVRIEAAFITGPVLEKYLPILCVRSRRTDRGSRGGWARIGKQLPQWAIMHAWIGGIERANSDACSARAILCIDVAIAP